MGYKCAAADMKKIRPKNKLHIILDDLDFSWTREEINEVVRQWNSGLTVSEIADIVRPWSSKINKRDETILLIIHLLREKKIKSRKEVIFEI